MNNVLKELRLQKKLTQEELAQTVGIDRTMLSKIENGYSCSIPVAMSLAKALNTTVEVLFGHYNTQAAARDSA